jgi:hypothetical protein
VRYSPIDPTAIYGITLLHDNPAWPMKLLFRTAGEDRELTVVSPDAYSGLRDGEALFWAPYKTLETDTRSMPFLSPVLDPLDSYDTVLSNLIDRTGLMRYFVWDVTVEGGQAEVDDFVAKRGGTHTPRSGTVEVHNNAVKWEAKAAQTGAYEDAKAAASVLTQAAAGSGLSKVWLAEPEDSNRATSQSMAEPVRRRVAGVQRMWLGYQAELVRLAVDRAVAAKRLPAMVEATDPKTRRTYEIPASQCVTITGPEIAAADAQITAKVLLNLATGLEKLVKFGALTTEAAAVASRKAWEDYVGVPWTADLAGPDADPDDIATQVDDLKSKLRAVP